MKLRASFSTESEALRARMVAALTHRGYSIRRLAAEARIPYKSLQNYLRGERATPADIVRRVSNVLGVSADWLLSGRAAAFSAVHVREALDFADGFREAGDATATLRDRARAFMEWYQHSYAEDWGDRLGEQPAADDPGRDAARRSVPGPRAKRRNRKRPT